MEKIRETADTLAQGLRELQDVVFHASYEGVREPAAFDFRSGSRRACNVISEHMTVRLLPLWKNIFERALHS